MPLTREQSNYINTGGTVFLPSVAIDNTLGVRGNSVFDGSVSILNNLGIGVSTPTSTLHVNGSIRLNTEADGQVIKLYGRTSDNFSQIATRKSDGSAYLNLLQFHGDTSFAFVQNTGYLTNTTSFAERMRIDSSGNVGVGTSSPLAKFHIGSSTTVSDFRMSNSVSSTVLNMYTTSNDVVLTVVPATGTLQLGTNNTERMRIDSSGSIKYSGQVAETVTVSATAANTTVTYDVITNKNVLYYTSNATADWTFNVRGNSTTTLNSMMDIGQSLTVVFMNTNGATAYRPTAFQIDGTAVTPKWFGGTAPTAGNASSIDVYTYNIIKTASATYTVLASQTKFA